MAADEQPILSWTTSKSASEYNLQLSSEQTFGSTQIDTTLSVSESGDAFSDTSFTVQNEFTNDTNYYWRVKALNEAGESAWSQTFSFFVETPDTIDVPDAPKLVYPENEETIRVGQTPELTWISSDGATEYKLHFAQNENFEQLLVDTTLTASGDATERSDTTYVIEDDLIGSETYFWRVRATNKAGESSWSETFSFLVVSGVSAEEEGSIPESFVLQQNYPNPFNPTTVIPYQLPKATHVTIRVFDMLGRKMSVLVDDEKPAGRHTIILDASYYSSGMYIYQMNADNKIFTKKLMLIK
ncbi:MAG: T9SS type A sorting domain-containing protein [Gracilimonas sp.]|nr:T9SS type A sorting domain-containing protein [Gracilimonas sp.]